jgi:hypothetical protein
MFSYCLTKTEYAGMAAEECDAKTFYMYEIDTVLTIEALQILSAQI